MAYHTPVLLKEVVTQLQPHRGGLYVDCTVGGGGHAREMLRACGPEGQLIGLKVGEQHSALDTFFGTDHLSAAELIRLRNEAECNYIKHHWVDFLNPVYLADRKSVV